MNNFIPKKNYLIFMIAITFLSTIFYFGGIFFLQKELSKVKNSYENIESEIFKKERIKAIEVMVNNNKDSIQKLRNFFVVKDDEVKFIEFIEESAKASEVDFEIDSITNKPDSLSNVKEDIIVKITIRGSWSNLIMFLDKIEKGTFGVLIKEVEADNNSTGGWFASVILNFYKEM